MKNLFISTTLVLASLFTTLPAKANPEAEACLNKLARTELQGLEKAKATLQGSITHNSHQYYWVELTPNPNSPAYIELIIKTNAQAGCDIVLFGPEGPLPTRADYDRVLGKSVNEKFMKAFREAR